MFRNKLSILPVPSHWGPVCLVNERGTIVPLLTGAASAPGASPRHRRQRCFRCSHFHDSDVGRVLATTNEGSRREGRGGGVTTYNTSKRSPRRAKTCWRKANVLARGNEHPIKKNYQRLRRTLLPDFCGRHRAAHFQKEGGILSTDPARPATKPLHRPQ